MAPPCMLENDNCPKREMAMAYLSCIILQLKFRAKNVNTSEVSKRAKSVA